MIVALLNEPHGVGKTTLALHLAGLWSYQTRHVAVIDADPQGRTLEWSEMQAQERLPRRFTVIGLTRNTLHRDAPNIARDVDRVIVDGPSHIAALTRSAPLTVDLLLVPVQLPPFDCAAFAETDKLHRPAGRPRRGGSDRPARVRDGPQRSSRPEETALAAEVERMAR